MCRCVGVNLVRGVKYSRKRVSLDTTATPPQAATHREDNVLEHDDDDDEDDDEGGERDVRRERWFHGILNRREPVSVWTGGVH